MKTMKLKKGDRFMARWPNTQFYYWSTIIEADGEKWKIQFDDGTVAVVKEDDLHDSPPASAINRVGRVTRSSPTKNRKRPEEIRKSPARKVRKLFALEEIVTLDSESSGVEENATLSGVHERKDATIKSNKMEVVKDKESHGNLTSTPGRARRSVSVTRDNEKVTHSTATPTRRSVSVPRDSENVRHSVADVRPSPFERSVRVTKDTEAVTNCTGALTRRSISVPRESENKTHSAGDVRQSPFKRSVSITKETEDGTHNVRPSLFRRSVSVSKETEAERHNTADDQSSLSKRSISVAIQKETLTHGVTRYTESYLDKDFRSRLMREGTIGSEGLRASPFRGSESLLKERVKLFEESAGRRPPPFRGSDSLLKDRMKLTDESAGLHPSSVKGLDTLLKERMKLTDESPRLHSTPIKGSDSFPKERLRLADDVSRYTESYLSRDFRRRSLREGSIGSAGLRPSPIRGIDSALKERVKLTDGSAGLRPSPIGGIDSALKERVKLTDEMSRYRESYPGGDYRRQLVKEGFLSSTHTTKFTLEDYEKKYLNKYPMEFGGRCGTLLLIMLLPLYIMGVFAFNMVPEPTKFEVLFEKHLVLLPQVAVGITLLLIFQAALTIVPIGTVASGPLTKLGISNMRCNGIFAALLTLILTLSACYFKREVADIVVNVHGEAAVTAMFLGIVFSLLLYRRAGKLSVFCLNPYGSTGFRCYDFWMGREVTPCIGKFKFNIKLILHRFTVIITIALNALIVTKAYMQGVEEDMLKSLMISTVLQSLYCVHFLSHEDIYLYSFLAMSEGVGYMMTVGFMTFPFMLTFTTKAILDYKLKATTTELYIALCMYTIGHLLIESSSYRKTLSVKDRASSVWMMRVVPKWSPGVQSRAYMGEIIIYWAFAMIAGTTQLGLFIIPSGFTISVLSRALREYTRSAAHPQGEFSTKQN